MPVILYERQRQILDYIAQYIQRNGFAPSLRNIADSMGLSSLATVHEHMSQLHRKGVINIIGRGKTRKVIIVDKKYSSIDTGVLLPILGFFDEGTPIKPYSIPHATFAVAPSMMTGKKRGFILCVESDSLSEDGIFKNDYIVLEEESGEVENGQAVVAILEGGVASLKRLFKEATRIKLEWLRAKKTPLYIPNVKIQGKVLGIIRKF